MWVASKVGECQQSIVNLAFFSCRYFSFVHFEVLWIDFAHSLKMKWKMCDYFRFRKDNILKSHDSTGCAPKNWNITPSIQRNTQCVLRSEWLKCLPRLQQQQRNGNETQSDYSIFKRFAFYFSMNFIEQWRSCLFLLNFNKNRTIPNSMDKKKMMQFNEWILNCIKLLSRML